MWTAFFLLLFFLSTSVLGTTGVDDTIHSVGTCSNYPPYNYADDSGAEVGFDKDFFKLLTSKVPDLGLDRFDLSNRTSTPYFSQSQLQAQIIKGKLDMGICCTYITGARQNVYNFPQGYFYSPYVIVVRKTESSLSVQDLLASFSGIVPWFAVFVAELLAFIALIYTHMLWFSESQTNEGFSSHYLRGIFQCVWFAITTVTTVGYGDKAPKKFLGRLSTMFWMVIGLILYGVFVGTIASSLTVRQISSEISGPDSLGGRTLVTASGSVSETLSKKYGDGGKLVYAADKMATFPALANGDQGANALVIDAPIANYIIQKTNLSDSLVAVGATFSPSRCGILVTKNMSDAVVARMNVGIANVLNSLDYQDLLSLLTTPALSKADQDLLYRAHTTKFGTIILLILLSIFCVGVIEKFLRMRRDAIKANKDPNAALILRGFVEQFWVIAKDYVYGRKPVVATAESAKMLGEDVRKGKTAELEQMVERLEARLAQQRVAKKSRAPVSQRKIIERFAEMEDTRIRQFEERVVARLSQIDEARVKQIEERIISRLRTDTLPQNPDSPAPPPPPTPQ